MPIHTCWRRAAHGQRQTAWHLIFCKAMLEPCHSATTVFDVVLAVTVLCFVNDAALAIREMTRVLRPGGHLVIGQLGRWNLWAARRRMSGWLGSRMWRSATFRTVPALKELVTSAVLAITMVRGAVYYPPIAPLAALLARYDPWIGKRTTAGAAFLVVVGMKPA
jgi:SAM-dependent methyltransferase